MLLTLHRRIAQSRGRPVTVFHVLIPEARVVVQGVTKDKLSLRNPVAKGEAVISFFLSFFPFFTFLSRSNPKIVAYVGGGKAMQCRQVDRFLFLCVAPRKGLQAYIYG